MNLSTEQIESFYVSIYLNPEYEKISYHFDYVTVIVIICFICFIPTVYATIKMVLFRNPQKSSTDIHPFVFKSFLCMQVSKVIGSILDLIVIRIPLTTILTSFYTTLERDSPLRFFTAACFSLNNLSQLFTVLFCLIRLLVFMNNQECLKVSCITLRFQILKQIISDLSLRFLDLVNHLIYLLCCYLYYSFLLRSNLSAASLPFSIRCYIGHIPTLLCDCMFIFCIYNSVIRKFQRLSAVVEVVFNAVISICVVVSTLLMLVKLKNMKQLSSISSKNTKAEKTLTITMFIIVYPTVLDEFIAVNSSSSE
ncbi:hypothetical protein CRE_10778 [Caenorhabditis remanei]|uniref:Uncharacterized protein n=1 Tax=Caenorhabditis remanei TaxID=31234 RepID=E3NUK1_CAERE|nr:hypothetical protein CRE_10778 [Caenorhabditis remanei]